jgi:23S rRNA (cytidine1920-2'-O)/16S rRNA (cytidine1409-2'-O)-methyltransferase
MKTRLDAELVRRELARSRENAVELIAAGKVLVNGIPATKAATQVDAQISITLKDEQAEFVSRGGHKLAGALDHFANLVVADKVALDAGASTGGFTDVLLKRGVKKVVAADVGYGQLAWQLQSDNRVKILDRVNVRSLTKEQVAEEIDLVVADLSFISLKIVLPALIAVAKDEADFLIMVKPQFEVGKEKLGAGGVVRDAALRKEAVAAVAAAAFSLGLGCLGVVASPLPGPSGNVEYFLWLSKAGQALLEVDLDLAIERGPA